MKLYLHQFLSGTGVFESKSEVYRVIREGEVVVDGRVVRNRLYQVKPGKDIVLWNGRMIELASEKTYIILNKPAGFLSSKLSGRDLKSGKKSVFDLLSGVDCKTRNSLFCVGRLDEDSSGLLLLTNDGVLCSKLTNPEHGVEKTYSVVLEKPLSHSDVELLEKGVVIDLEENSRVREYKTKECKIKIDSKDGKKLEITLTEGKKREIRRMFETLGMGIIALTRISIGCLNLKDLGLNEGEYRVLDKKLVEEKALKQVCN